MIDTEFYSNWYQQVCRPPYNDYVVVVSAGSRTPVSGTGKTTKGLGIAKTFDPDFDTETQASLNADEFANEVIPNAPNGGAVLMDEAQGTPGGGSGFNRMRAMSQSTLDAVGSVLANRDKRLTIIIVVQQFGMLFSDFYPLVDSWFLITETPGSMRGPLAKHHRVYLASDYPDMGGGLKTPILELVDWPAISESDPDYQILEQKKQEAKQKRNPDEESEGESPDLNDSQQQRLAQSLRAEGWTLREIADHDMIDYSHQWVSEHTTAVDQDYDKQEATA